jgi:hypothetical protein
MSEKKPDPILVNAKGKVCPVCGKQSYSQAGIHPQCAAIQTDAIRAEQLREKRKRDASEKTQSSWNSKLCPKCNHSNHVRKKKCRCGYVFF